jgi:hypothetical protein
LLVVLLLVVPLLVLLLLLEAEAKQVAGCSPCGSGRGSVVNGIPSFFLRNAAAAARGEGHGRGSVVICDCNFAFGWNRNGGRGCCWVRILEKRS